LISGSAGFYDGWSSNDPFIVNLPNASQSFEKVDGHHVWLFDLEKDPRELTNVAKANSEIVHSMQTRLDELSDEKNGYVAPDYSNNIPHLRALPFRHNGTWAPFLGDEELLEETDVDVGMFI